MKEIQRTNFQIVVRPKTGDLGRLEEQSVGEAYLARCNEIADQIRRHVDRVGTVRVAFESREVCGFCCMPWEVVTERLLKECPELFEPGDQLGQPVCCEKAIDEWRAAQTGGTA